MPRVYRLEWQRRATEGGVKMKYIAIFDIPDDCTIGCAVAKIAKKGKEEYTDKDFTWIYADVEPLAKDKEEVFDHFKTVEIFCTCAIYCSLECVVKNTSLKRDGADNPFRKPCQ